MLIRFEVSNFRSILEPVELSMVAVDRDRDAARPVEMLDESLLTVAAIYGSNASGKSNVLAAHAWLQAAVANSLRQWDDKIPVEPFAFGDGPTRPTEFTAEYVVDGVRFEYVLELDRESVRYEGLFHFPERRRRRIFERNGLDLVLQRGLGGLSGVRELLTPRVLALSIARRFEEPLVAGFARTVLMGDSRGVRQRQWQAQTDRHVPSMLWFVDSASTDVLEGRSGRIDEGDRQRALGMLRLADLGIADVRLTREQLGSADQDGLRAYSRLRLRFFHHSAGAPVALDLEDESLGTQAWFEAIGPVLSALRDGSLLLFDELDASLHPVLSTELIRLFADPATNPYGAQLVFTSHDTSLLNHLNRDEVWLTEKGADGVSRLGALAEFAGERVRRSANLEQAYLHGRFGAIPQVDRAGMFRALGLTG